MYETYAIITSVWIVRDITLAIPQQPSQVTLEFAVVWNSRFGRDTDLGGEMARRKIGGPNLQHHMIAMDEHQPSKWRWCFKCVTIPKLGYSPRSERRYELLVSIYLPICKLTKTSCCPQNSHKTLQEKTSTVPLGPIHLFLGKDGDFPAFRYVSWNRRVKPPREDMSWRLWDVETTTELLLQEFRSCRSGVLGFFGVLWGFGVDMLQL